MIAVRHYRMCLIYLVDVRRVRSIVCLRRHDILVHLTCTNVSFSVDPNRIHREYVHRSVTCLVRNCLLSSMVERDFLPVVYCPCTCHVHDRHRYSLNTDSLDRSFNGVHRATCRTRPITQAYESRHGRSSPTMIVKNYIHVENR
jgi:hypothetical protein